MPDVSFARMAKDEISNPAQEAPVPPKGKGGRPLGSKNKPIFTPEQCTHAADLLAADGTRKAVAAYLGTSIQTSYAYVSAADVEAAKLRRAENIAKGIEVLPLQQRNVLAPGKRKGAAPQIDDQRHVEILRTLLACNDYNEAAEIEKVNPRVIYRAIPAKTLQAVQDQLKAAKGQPITYLGQLIEPPKVKPPERKSGLKSYIDKYNLRAARKSLMQGYPIYELAEELHVSPKTLYRQLQLTPEQKAAAKAARNYVIPPELLKAIHYSLVHGAKPEVLAAQHAIPAGKLATTFPETDIAQERADAIKLALVDGQSRSKVATAFNTSVRALDKSHPHALLAPAILGQQLQRHRAKPPARRNMAAHAFQEADLIAALNKAEARVKRLSPQDSIIAVPLVAAAKNKLARSGLDLPFGWRPDELWQGFIAHNRELYADYKKATIHDPVIDRMMLRFNIQQITPEVMATAERDDFILARGKEKLPGKLREVFLLLAQPYSKNKSRKILGELWVDTPVCAEEPVMHHYVMNPQTKAAPPVMAEVFVLTREPEKYQPLKFPQRAPKIDD